MGKMIVVGVDQENNAERFWDFVHSLSDQGLRAVVPESVLPLLKGGETVTVPAEDAEVLRLWVETLGDMGRDGPEYAREPFTFSDE